MRIDFLNKRQKKILYRNVTILFALTAACGILARCGNLGGGETLADLNRKQGGSEEISEHDEDLSVDENEIPEMPSAQPEDTADPSDEKAALPENIGDPSDEEPALSENTGERPDEEPDRPREDDLMDDRVTYQEGFYYQSLSDTVKERITGISYPADDSGAAISYDTLRYVRVLYYDFNGQSQSGELICHKAIAWDLLEIFHELYEAHYPIEKICLVEEYQGDDSLSMQDNNTSCFNYRALPSGRLSNHSYGLAIDLNPFYNPYVITRKDGSVTITPEGSEIYADREQSFLYKIDKEDLAYQLFIQHGFTWGGSWRSSKDYQHFEKAI